MVRLSKSQLRKEYLVNKLTDNEIASKYKCSGTWVATLRTNYGIGTLKPYERNKRQLLSQIQLELVMGTLLGDGSIKFSGRKGNKNGYLSIAQTDKALTELKFRIMKSFVKTVIKVYHDKRNRKPIYYFRTISHPIFTELYDTIYIKGIKTISMKWLEFLTPFSLAIWYMDDGSVVESTHQMRISTESFSYEDHLIIKKYFKDKWDTSIDIKSSSRKGKFILSFKAEERDKLFRIIRSHIIKEMCYKVCENLIPWKIWTDYDIGYLRKNFMGRRTKWEMFQNLNHSKSAIQRKASYLGLCGGNQE